MALPTSKPFGLFLASICCASIFHFSLPGYGASALAAWVIRSDGVLELRTKVGTKLKAYFQASSYGKGERVWIDFPGELSRPRKISGNGPVREVRLGKPFKGFTRLVIEFAPFIELDPEQLKLVGTSPYLWELSLVGLPLERFIKIGEGDVNKVYKKSRISGYKRREYSKLNSSDLPTVIRNRYKIVIDPGHGGPDPGAVGIGGLRETDVVLDVSLKVSDYLISKGIQVLLTRKRDVDLDLSPRVEIANNYGANAFVSIHANASRGNRRDVNGLETYYYAGYRGYKLAKKIQKEIIQASSGSPDRGVRRSRFFVIKKTDMPAVLVEIGFVTGRIDSRKLKQKEHRQKLAFAIAKGILNYLKEAS